MRFTLGIEKDISGLEIAMEDGALVRVVDGPGDFHEEACGLAGIERDGVCGQALSERAAFDELHAEKRTPVLLAHLVNGNDIRMVEPGGGLGLGTESLHLPLAGELAGEHQLECDHAIKGQIARPIHHTHTAVGDLLEQVVAAQSPETRVRLVPGFPPSISPRPQDGLRQRGFQHAPRAHAPGNAPHRGAASWAILIDVHRHALR